MQSSGDSKESFFNSYSFILLGCLVFDLFFFYLLGFKQFLFLFPVTERINMYRRKMQRFFPNNYS